MSTVASVHHLQIERIIRRSNDNVQAEFLHKGRPTCRAMICPRAGLQYVHVEAFNLTVVDASGLSIALQMAVDWIAEESVKLSCDKTRQEEGF